MEAIYGENWGLTLAVSALIGWGVGLTPPLLLRYAIVRRPIGKGWAIGTVCILWLVNLIGVEALGSTSKTHAGLFLVALVSYYILRAGAPDPAVKVAASSAPLIPVQEQSVRRTSELIKIKYEDGGVSFSVPSFAITAALIAGCGAVGLFAYQNILGPRTFDECVAARAGDIHDKIGAAFIIRNCREKFAKKFPSNELDTTGLTPIR